MNSIEKNSGGEVCRGQPTRVSNNYTKTTYWINWYNPFDLIIFIVELNGLSKLSQKVSIQATERKSCFSHLFDS